MENNQLHLMLRRLFQHTQSMRKCQRNAEITRTKYDKQMAKMLEKQVDLDISNIDSYLHGNITPPAPPPS